jgi:hypothetical protein
MCFKDRNQTESPLVRGRDSEFQAGERAEPSLDLIEIPLIDIHRNDPLCGVAVDLV